MLPVGTSLGFDENIRRVCRNETELNVELNKQFGSVLTNNIDKLYAVKSDQKAPTLKLNYSIKLNQNNNDFLSHMSLNRKLEFLHQNIS